MMDESAPLISDAPRAPRRMARTILAVTGVLLMSALFLGVSRKAYLSEVQKVSGGLELFFDCLPGCLNEKMLNDLFYPDVSWTIDMAPKAFSITGVTDLLSYWKGLFAGLKDPVLKGMEFMMIEHQDKFWARWTVSGTCAKGSNWYANKVDMVNVGTFKVEKSTSQPIGDYTGWKVLPGYNTAYGKIYFLQQCAGNYQSDVPCCGQAADANDHSVTSDKQCPVYAPYCSNYVYGAQWGLCGNHQFNLSYAASAGACEQMCKDFSDCTSWTFTDSHSDWRNPPSPQWNNVCTMRTDNTLELTEVDASQTAGYNLAQVRTADETFQAVEVSYVWAPKCDDSDKTQQGWAYNKTTKALTKNGKCVQVQEPKNNRKYTFDSGKTYVQDYWFVLMPCDGSLAQQFDWTDDLQIHVPKANKDVADGQCLNSFGSGLIPVALPYSCSYESKNQKWLLLEGGVMKDFTGQCLADKPHSEPALAFNQDSCSKECKKYSYFALSGEDPGKMACYCVNDVSTLENWGSKAVAPVSPGLKCEVVEMMGCYYDYNSGTKVLPHKAEDRFGDNTQESCAERVAEAIGVDAVNDRSKWMFIGVEYGGQCYYGHHINNAKNAPDGDCSTPCPGDSSQKCGAGERINMYTAFCKEVQPQIASPKGYHMYENKPTAKISSVEVIADYGHIDETCSNSLMSTKMACLAECSKNKASGCCQYDENGCAWHAGQWVRGDWSKEGSSAANCGGFANNKGGCDGWNQDEMCG